MSDDEDLHFGDEDEEEEDEETRRLEEEIRRLEEERRQLEENDDDDDDYEAEVVVDRAGKTASTSTSAAETPAAAAGGLDGDEDEDEEDEELRRLQAELDALKAADADDDHEDSVAGEDRGKKPAASGAAAPASPAPAGNNAGTVKEDAADDSALEGRLDLKWNEFMGSLPSVAKPKDARLEDHYNADQMKQFAAEGSKIMSALRVGKPDDDGKWAAVVPSYLRGVLSQESRAKAESANVPKYYIDIFRRANPDIVVKADYAELFGECAEEDASGLFIWRMEMLLPIEVDREQYPDKEEGRLGALNCEDCYVILHITNEKVGKVFSIFNWVGEDASIDKRGASAIRAQELNLYLRGRAKLRTEFQGMESDAFRTCFGQVDMLYEDGADSVFRPPAKPAWPRRLFRVTLVRPSIVGYPIPEKKAKGGAAGTAPGRRPKLLPAITEMELQHASLNETDSFVLDGGTDEQLFVWHGAKSPLTLRAIALAAAHHTNEHERLGRSVIHELVSGEESREIRDGDHVWCMLDYLDVDAGAKLQPKGEQYVDDIILYRTRIEDGKVKLPKVRDGPDDGVLEREMLHSDSVALLDAFSELFVWVGRRSHGRKYRLRKVVGTVAANLRKQEDRPPNVNVTTIFEGHEPISFINKFPCWFAELTRSLIRGNYSRPLAWQVHLAAAQASWTFRPEDIDRDGQRVAGYMPDEGDGSVEVWAVENGKPTFTKLPVGERGEFYTGDCFLVLYTYHNPLDRMRQAYVLYFWEGREASNRWWPAFWYGFFPVLNRKIRNAGGKAPYVELVYEHQEPEHFMKLFGNRIVVHAGHRKTAPGPNVRRLYHIRRSFELSYAVEVPCEAKRLNSFDSFALVASDKLFLWYGKGVEYEESQAALRSAERLSRKRELLQIDQGDEDGSFWNMLGGWVDYPCGDEYLKKYRGRAVRLHRATQEGGTYRIVTEPRWSQMSVRVHSADTFILDTYFELYVFSGRQCSESVALRTVELAREFMRFAAARRGVVVDLHVVPVGERPPEHMTRHFHTWVHETYFVDPEIARDERLRESLFELYKDAEAERNDESQLRHEERLLTRLKRVDMEKVARREIARYDELVAEATKRHEAERAAADARYAAEVDQLRLLERSECVDYAADDDVLMAMDSDDEAQHDGVKYDDVVLEDEVKTEKRSVADEYVERYARSTRHGRMYGGGASAAPSSDSPADIARARRRR